MPSLLCHFVALDDGTCRCARPGCGNRLRAADPAACRAQCRAVARDLLSAPCRHLGAATGESFRCRGCPGSPRVHALFGCAVHGACLPLAQAAGATCCANCPDYQPGAEATGDQP